jgi:hypothetical protein
VSLKLVKWCLLVLLCGGLDILSAQTQPQEPKTGDSTSHPSPSHPAKTASPHFKVGDMVEVLLFGEWTKGQLLAIDRRQYNVQLPDGAKYWMSGAQVRKVMPPTPSGQPPKPGLTSCSGKMDGKYSSPSGFPSIVFHSGKASVQGDDEVECWMGAGKIYLHSTGTRADQDFVMGIKSDGTLDTPLGEIRKKDN